MNKWKKKYKKLRKKYLLLNQGSLLHCNRCGWNTIIPYEDTICLNCHYWEDKMKEKEMADMNPINNLDTFQGRGYQIEQMKQKLQSIQNKINQFKMELNNAPSVVQYEKETLLNFIDSLTP